MNLQKTLLNTTIVATLFIMTACTPPPVISAACVDFEPPLVVGTDYGTPAGQTPGDIAFTASTITVRVQDFQFIAGGTTFNVATVDPAMTTPTTFGTGQIMRLNNINLEFDFSGLSFQATQVDLKYLDLGGYENLSVNKSTPAFVDDLSKAPPSLGGASLTVTAATVTGGKTGTITLTGSATAPIQFLTIGGQELWIDEVCARK